MTVPHSLLDAAERLAQDLGTTRNAALVRLAEEGVAARERRMRIAALASERRDSAVGIVDGMHEPGYLWLGSVGYEHHKDHEAFARHVQSAGVERLIDVRELPISRRRGYAKSALSRAMADVDIEYVHIKALGNPKPFRDLYKSGHVEEGRRCYEAHLLGERRDALEELVPLLREKRCALMCVEHDSATCHRTVIFDALRSEFGIKLDVAEIS